MAKAVDCRDDGEEILKAVKVRVFRGRVDGLIERVDQRGEVRAEG